MNAAEFDEKVFEVEKGVVLLNGTVAYSSQALHELEDGPAWFDARSGRGLAGLEDVRLPMGYKWTSNWKLYNFANEGWEPRPESTHVRQRKWVRRREKISQPSTASSKTTVSSPEADLALARQCGLKLREAMARMEAASARRTKDGIAREGRELIAQTHAILARVPQSEGMRAVAQDLVRDQRRFEQLVMSSASSAPSVLVPSSSSLPSPVAQQQQQQQTQLREVDAVLSHEIETNSALLAEREVEIVKIHKMAHQVNGMMKDLAVLVAEQGEDVAKAKQTTAQVKQNVKAGLGEVRKAAQIQEEGAGCSVS